MENSVLTTAEKKQWRVSEAKTKGLKTTISGDPIVLGGRDVPSECVGTSVGVCPDPLSHGHRLSSSGYDYIWKKCLCFYTKLKILVVGLHSRDSKTRPHLCTLTFPTPSTRPPSLLSGFVLDATLLSPGAVAGRAVRFEELCVCTPST